MMSDVDSLVEQISSYVLVGTPANKASARGCACDVCGSPGNGMGLRVGYARDGVGMWRGSGLQRGRWTCETRRKAHVVAVIFWGGVLVQWGDLVLCEMNRWSSHAKVGKRIDESAAVSCATLRL